VAPDQRGYNQSDKPASVEAYFIDHLANDIRGLIRHYGFTTATVRYNYDHRHHVHCVRVLTISLLRACTGDRS
jgi:hypothetical protein